MWIMPAYFVFAALCIFAVVRLYGAGKVPAAKSALGVYAFYTLVFSGVRVLKIDVPGYLLLLTMLAVLGASFFGHFLGCYVKSRIFDRYLHCFGSFSFSLLTYVLLANYVNTSGSILFRAIFVFLLGNTLGVIFELIEMHHDKKNKEEPKSQKGLRDTDMDMIFNLIGSALAAVFAYFCLLDRI